MDLSKSNYFQMVKGITHDNILNKNNNCVYIETSCRIDKAMGKQKG